MRARDGMRILGPDVGPFTENPKSVSRELMALADTGERWRREQVIALADAALPTHWHLGEPKALIILEDSR